MQPLPQAFKRRKSGARAPLQGNTVVHQIGNDHGAAEQLQAQAEQSGDQIRRVRRSAKRPNTQPLYPNAECRSNTGDTMEMDDDDEGVEGNGENEVDMTLRNNPRRKKYFIKPSL